MDTNTPSKKFPRHVKDFLSPQTAERAGIIEVRAGAAEPRPYTPGFGWPAGLTVSSLEYDSRKVTEGALYFALSGLHADGHDFVPEAVARGAAVVVHEKNLDRYEAGAVYIRVRDSRFAMSPVAAAFWDFPSRRMAVIGVTGTEGKSTTVYLIYRLLKLLGKRAGFISTVMRDSGAGEVGNSEHQTTPEATAIHALLAEMVRNGLEYAVIEASSHGLSQEMNRLGDVDFDVGVMTNVTHEHLEFHGTWENYRDAKAALFRALDLSPSGHRKLGAGGEVKVPSFGVVNGADSSAAFFRAATGQKTFTFYAAVNAGSRAGDPEGAKVDLRLKSIVSGSGGNRLEVLAASTGEVIALEDRLPGAFNAGNVLAALLTVSGLCGTGLQDLAPLVPRLTPVRGRMTAVNRGQPFELLVDYAHTPTSFGAVLPPLKERLKPGARLICLFGSAGERDTQKRPLQGEVAARYADVVILADEDPRGEAPMAILEEIAGGADAGCLSRPGMLRGETLFLIPSRPEAIRKAVALAREGDIVLLLGKGHENSIIYSSGTIAYDEIAEAERALEEAGFRLR